MLTAVNAISLGTKLDALRVSSGLRGHTASTQKHTEFGAHNIHP